VLIKVVLKQIIKKIKSIVVVCHGNILRSQVLEKYLKHYSEMNSVKLKLYSAGIAEWEAYENTEDLLQEVEKELNKRGLLVTLKRNIWNKEVEKQILDADFVLAADADIKTVILSRMEGSFSKEKVYTYYEFIDEGEKSFQDTYDHILKRQDPVRFEASFNELARIAEKAVKLNF